MHAAPVIDRDAYARDGYLCLGPLLDARTVAALIAEEARFRQRDRRLTVLTQLMHRSALVREVATQGPQIAAVVALLGPNVALTHQQYVTKTPAPGTPDIDVPWHQDNGYGRLAPMTDITVWFALTDCDTDTGCLWVLPGSHRGPLAEHRPMHGLLGVDLDDVGTPIPMRAGDAIAFSGLLLHCSKAHRGNAPRHAFYTRYCEPTTHMIAPGGGKPVLDDGYSWMVAGEAP